MKFFKGYKPQFIQYFKHDYIGKKVELKKKLVLHDSEDKNNRIEINKGQKGSITGVRNMFGSNMYVVNIDGVDMFVNPEKIEKLFELNI